jgi:hypothetical protein
MLKLFRVCLVAKWVLGGGGDVVCFVNKRVQTDMNDT